MKSYDQVEERGFELMNRGNEISKRLQYLDQFDMPLPEHEAEKQTLIDEKAKILAQLFLIQWLLED